jgi:hypothetical protein
VLTAGKFLTLIGIILPLVPDTRLIAAAPVTPYQVWLAVGRGLRPVLSDLPRPALSTHRGWCSCSSAARRPLLLHRRHRRARQGTETGGDTARRSVRWHRRCDRHDVPEDRRHYRVLQPGARDQASARLGLPVRRRRPAGLVGVAKDRAWVRQEIRRPCRQPAAGDNCPHFHGAVSGCVAGDHLDRIGHLAKPVSSASRDSSG